MKALPSSVARVRVAARLPFAWILLASVLAGACGGPTGPTDAGPPDAADDVAGDGRVADSSIADTGGADGGPTDVVASDAPGGDAAGGDAVVTDAPTGDAASCTVSDAGMLQRNYYCDQGAIHVLQRDGAAATVEVAARVGSGGGCRAIDSIEIVRGSMSLQRFDTTTRVDSSAGNGTTLGTAMAAPGLVSECANETTRLSAYGIIVRGRDAMGPFEARCGSAASGSRWPPGTHLACHRNVEGRPLNNPSSSIQVMVGAGFTTAMLFVAVLHPAGRPAFTTVDGTMRIVSPERYVLGGGLPLVSRDVPGWTGSASESMSGFGSFTQVSLNSFMVILGTELCPVPPAMPGPGTPPPPFFLARLTGRNATGPVSVEALASCATVMR